MTTPLSQIVEQMREAAEAATPGPWFLHDFSDPIVSPDPSARDVTVSCDHPATITIAEMGGGLYGHKGLEQARKDAAHIAASNPANVVAILSALDAAEARAATEAMQFIAAEIDRAPEPLRRLGEYLSLVLDEDEFKTADRMLLGAAEATNADRDALREAARAAVEAMTTVKPFVCTAPPFDKQSKLKLMSQFDAALAKLKAALVDTTGEAP